MSFDHVTVLCDEAVAALAPEASSVIVDCTLGGGGHSEALLRAGAGRVIGIDRDPQALAAASARLAPFGDRFVAAHAAFDELEEVLDGLGLATVDGVLADLGVSSPQLDHAERGLSLRQAGPVDMRMDPTRGITAAELLASIDEAELTRIIREYGEDRQARRIARALIADQPFADTAALAATVASVVGFGGQRIHPATRTFQALRIAVNDELGQIERLLPQATRRLAPGGRLAIISFHSLEDRLVKRYLAHAAGRDLPRDPYGEPIGEITMALAPSVTPSPSDPNPRARSARLRSAQRLPWNAR